MFITRSFNVFFPAICSSNKVFGEHFKIVDVHQIASVRCKRVFTVFDFGQTNAEQLKAIQQTEGPVLIIAGPGTGKTFTLVKRALYLIVEKGVKPENILIATFTEKAAKELITRISNELIKLNITVNINSFHSYNGLVCRDFSA